MLNRIKYKYQTWKIKKLNSPNKKHFGKRAQFTHDVPLQLRSSPVGRLRFGSMKLIPVAIKDREGEEYIFYPAESNNY